MTEQQAQSRIEDHALYSTIPLGSIPNDDTKSSRFLRRTGADCLVPTLCAHSWQTEHRGMRLSNIPQSFGRRERGSISCTHVANSAQQFTQKVAPFTANLSRTTVFSSACIRSTCMYHPFAVQAERQNAHVPPTTQGYPHICTAPSPCPYQPCAEVL